jgi:hypothetical protein
MSNPISRLFHKLVEMRWFYTFSASCTATIVGISLTFGINSCRENRRVQSEARQSVVQAVRNLHNRSELIDNYLDIISGQDSIYSLVLDMHHEGTAIPDSTAEYFFNSMLSFKINISDKCFEKIFLGSYQLWQELNQNELTGIISAAYSITGMLEDYCESNNRQLVQEIKQCGISTNFPNEPYQNMVKTLLDNKNFCFYMTTRVKYTKSMNAANELHHELIQQIDSMCDSLNYVDDNSDDFHLEKTVTDEDD